MSLQIIILAAGAGTRMKSTLPKVMHVLGGKILLQYVYETAQSLLPEHEQPIIVYGHGGEQLKKMCEDWSAIWVHQSQQLGTGHAVQQALSYLKTNHRVLILYGDVPLLDAEQLRTFLDTVPANAIGILSAEVASPTGYGRILRDAQRKVIGIVEEKDAAPDQRAITEINTGIICAPMNVFDRYLKKLGNNNKQGEFYLTDIIAHAHDEQQAVVAIPAADNISCLGINTRAELANMERQLQLRHAKSWMERGVHLADPSRFDVRGKVNIGQDTFIDFNVLLSGKVTIGKGCHIESNVILHNVILEDHVHVRANSIIEGAHVGQHAIVGPFARVRPDSQLAEGVHIGNFVEIKQSQVGAGTKISHLSYIGDSLIGARVNVGAGTITCNYDGVKKHRTIIEDDVFIGSDTQLVAPVTVKHHATIAAGSTITKDVDSHELTLTHTLNHRTRKKKVQPTDK